jgi:hypothetical protein
LTISGQSYDGSYMIFGKFDVSAVVRWPVGSTGRSHVVQNDYAAIMLNGEIAWLSNPTYLYEEHAAHPSDPALQSTVGFGEGTLAWIFGEDHYNPTEYHGALLGVTDVPGYRLKHNYDTRSLAPGVIFPQQFANVATSLGPLTLWSVGENKAATYFTYEAGEADRLPTPAPEPASRGLAAFGIFALAFLQLRHGARPFSTREERETERLVWQAGLMKPSGTAARTCSKPS